ncbi:DUF2501 domain-containing protein [Variovorax sp. J22P240]|uniref:DUF2501 domain-containing protein n=1 Tax=unclassified Variovorax TaxID=663243 RepID=UPI002578D169|nr:MULTISPECIES: DUF2501 domain-containing protein [unclassified Variovorax]MDL9999617.1 DUF2501 domain-containing protein [Variovorax sp. J22P240]MDM0049040.1 DUF2501 domain-containing protein [Variovorax sp. J22R115]
MTISRYPFASIGAALVLLATGSVQAQGLDALKGLAGGGGSSSALGSMASGSLGNAAGVLEYCLKNKYLSGDAASSVKDQLMSKIPGGKPASDSGYVDGSQGILTGSDGKKMDLTGGGLKQEITKRACDFVLQQGKSMI